MTNDCHVDVEKRKKIVYIYIIQKIRSFVTFYNKEKKNKIEILLTSNAFIFNLSNIVFFLLVSRKETCWTRKQEASVWLIKTRWRPIVVCIRKHIYIYPFDIFFSLYKNTTFSWLHAHICSLLHIIRRRIEFACSIDSCI